MKLNIKLISVAFLFFALGFIGGYLFLSEIPVAVIAALLASALTLSGVMLSNINSRNMHLDKLKHDSDENDRNREMELKKDVYMKTAEVMTDMLSLIIQVCNLNKTDEMLQKSLEESRAVSARMQVIGNNNTVQSVTSLSMEIGKTLFNLILRRVELLRIKNDIEINTDLADQMKEELDQQLEFMKQMNLDGNSDKRKWDTVNSNCEFYKNQRDNYLSKSAELRKKKLTEELKLFSSCYEEYIRVSKYYPNVILAIREELNLPIDEDKFIQNMEESLKEGKVILEEFIENTKKLAEKQQ